ncbi:MAG: hypothetical protein M1823_005318 [Watsoniomyces obsoletus]|nr:MAG: hypothetical protein M1823_005318 [Watsoniomyces obsoletus]
MPTIALINGHAFAGGFMLAMHHDYRVFNPERGFLCLNELEFGVALYPPMSSVFRQKLPNPSTYRDIVLEARRYAAQDALKEGIVDTLGKLPETLQLVRERNLLTKASSGVYGELKAEMWRESVALLDGHQQNQKHQEGVRKRMDIEKEVGKRRVVEWQRSQTRSKL